MGKTRPKPLFGQIPLPEGGPLTGLSFSSFATVCGLFSWWLAFHFWLAGKKPFSLGIIPGLLFMGICVLCVIALYVVSQEYPSFFTGNRPPSTKNKIFWLILFGILYVALTAMKTFTVSLDLETAAAFLPLPALAFVYFHGQRESQRLERLNGVLHEAVKRENIQQIRNELDAANAQLLLLQGELGTAQEQLLGLQGIEGENRRLQKELETERQQSQQQSSVAQQQSQEQLAVANQHAKELQRQLDAANERVRQVAGQSQRLQQQVVELQQKLQRTYYESPPPIPPPPS